MGELGGSVPYSRSVPPSIREEKEVKPAAAATAPADNEGIDAEVKFTAVVDMARSEGGA